VEHIKLTRWLLGGCGLAAITLFAFVRLYHTRLTHRPVARAHRYRPARLLCGSGPSPSLNGHLSLHQWNRGWLPSARGQSNNWPRRLRQRQPLTRRPRIRAGSSPGGTSTCVPEPQRVARRRSAQDSSCHTFRVIPKTRRVTAIPEGHFCQAYDRQYDGASTTATLASVAFLIARWRSFCQICGRLS